MTGNWRLRSSLLIKPKFLNTDLGTKYCHLFLSILCIACKGGKQDYLSSLTYEFNIYLFLKRVSLVASEVESGKRNNQNQTPTHQATQKLNRFSGAHVKCAYTNTCNLGNKQEELELHVQRLNYDIVEITAMCWGTFYGWISSMDDGYQLIKKAGKKKR